MKCVYNQINNCCNGNCSFRGEEHVLPRGFGEFKGYLSLRGIVCDDCNNKLSKHDEILLRAPSLETILRVNYGIKGRKTHRKKDPFHERTHGYPPLKVFVLGREGKKVFLELLPENKARPRRELIFKKQSKTGQEDPGPLPIPHSVNTREKLLECISKAGYRPEEIEAVSCPADAGEEEFIRLVSETFNIPFERIQEGAIREGVPTTTTVEIHLPSEYYQAIAKIAFHYYLGCDSQIDGFNDIFNGIKQFIWKGGDFGTFLSSSICFIPAHEIPDESPWGHTLTTSWNETKIVSKVHLFAWNKISMNIVYEGISKSGEKQIIKPPNNSTQCIEVLLGTLKVHPPIPWIRLHKYIGFKSTDSGFDGKVERVF
jgi:hypothetical protein